MRYIEFYLYSSGSTNYTITATNPFGYSITNLTIASAYCVGGFQFGGVCYRLANVGFDCQSTCSSYGNLGVDSISMSAANCQTVLNTLLGSVPAGGYVQWAGSFPCLYETISPFRGIYSTVGFNPNYSNYRAACPCIN